MKTNRNVNTILKAILCLPMAALLLALAIAGPASAGQLVPFKGTIKGTEDFTFQAPDENGIDLLINGSGGGNATHLGAFSATWGADINTMSEGDSTIFRTFVAANGDEIYAQGPGAGTPPPDQFVTEMMSITGGTGRFEDASGSFTIERTVFDVFNPGITDLVTVGTFDGFISRAGSTRRLRAVPEPASITLALGCVLGMVTCVRRRTMGR